MTTWKARPTTYRGIQMRSRLEATHAAWLDRRGWQWVYEPRAFADENGQYLPDFQVLAPIPPPSITSGVYHEVKPTVELAMAALPRVQIILASEPNAFLFVWVPGVGHFGYHRSLGPTWAWCLDAAL